MSDDSHGAKPIPWSAALLGIAVSISRGGNQAAIKFALAAVITGISLAATPASNDADLSQLG